MVLDLFLLVVLLGSCLGIRLSDYSQSSSPLQYSLRGLL